MEHDSTLRPEDYLAYAGSLRTLALQLVRDEHEADDVVQDTWLAALRHPPAERGGLRWWLGAVARNVARQTRRSEGRRAERQRRVSVPERLPPTEEVAERAAMHREIVDRVLALDEPYRVVLLLRYFEDLTPKQIASRLGLPVATVNTRLLRARVRLRETLDRRFGDRSSWCKWFLLGLGKTGVGGMSVSSLVPIAQAAAITALVGFVGYVCVRVYLDEREVDGLRGVVALPTVPVKEPVRELAETGVRGSDDTERRPIGTGSSPARPATREKTAARVERPRKERPGPWTEEGIPGLVHIEGGRTRVGTTVGAASRLITDNPDRAVTIAGETPRHEVGVGDFLVMVTEVTNEQYLQFVRSTGAGNPGGWKLEWLDLEEMEWTIPEEALDVPVTYVDYEAASAYARWAGLRLMTEFEYQRVARGDTERIYPWGDYWTAAHTAVGGQVQERPFPVGSFRHGAVDGVFDLAGNVWEWTSSPYVAYPDFRPMRNKEPAWDENDRVVVGGSFLSPEVAQRATTRRPTNPEQDTDALGFRCAAWTHAGLDRANALRKDLKEAIPEHLELLSFPVILERWTSAPGKSRNRVPGYRVITGYDCVLFLPADRPLPQVHERALFLGILDTTVPFREPELPPGTYSVVRVAGGTSYQLGGTKQLVETGEDVFVFLTRESVAATLPAPPLEQEFAGMCRIELEESFPPGSLTIITNVRDRGTTYGFRLSLLPEPGVVDRTWRSRR